jgi:hypothetical protein
VLSSIQLLVNAAWDWNRRQGTVHFIVIVIDIRSRTAEGWMNRNCIHIKRTLAGRVFLHVFCSPGACLSPGHEALHILCYQLPSLSGWPRTVPGATETERRQSNINKTPCLMQLHGNVGWILETTHTRSSGLNLNFLLHYSRLLCFQNEVSSLSDFI